MNAVLNKYPKQVFRNWIWFDPIDSLLKCTNTSHSFLSHTNPYRFCPPCFPYCIWKYFQHPFFFINFILISLFLPLTFSFLFTIILIKGDTNIHLKRDENFALVTISHSLWNFEHKHHIKHNCTPPRLGWFTENGQFPYLTICAWQSLTITLTASDISIWRLVVPALGKAALPEWNNLILIDMLYDTVRRTNYKG